ncbi:hypothetical protein Purlil1_7548 [Purpureocillium lilacinum]|uniref:Uncharacterized protein n=1 Tax=Purpureocillium lilacinum TaxID=33203 RepID=A0ABR0BVJ1_PURLI|nr:hypothetical protein Purlil1_7548 [Purpureocillium lilacinum]
MCAYVGGWPPASRAGRSGKEVAEKRARGLAALVRDWMPTGESGWDDEPWSSTRGGRRSAAEAGAGWAGRRDEPRGWLRCGGEAAPSPVVPALAGRGPFKWALLVPCGRSSPPPDPLVGSRGSPSDPRARMVKRLKRGLARRERRPGAGPWYSTLLVQDRTYEFSTGVPACPNILHPLHARWAEDQAAGPFLLSGWRAAGAQMSTTSATAAAAAVVLVEPLPGRLLLIRTSPFCFPRKKRKKEKLKSTAQATKGTPLSGQSTSSSVRRRGVSSSSLASPSVPGARSSTLPPGPGSGSCSLLSRDC